MTAFHLSALLASLATGIALPLRFEAAASLLFAAGFALIVVNDYARAPRLLRTPDRRRLLRPRAHFRPLPLSLPTEPRGIEIRPIIHRLRERHRLAA